MDETINTISRLLSETYMHEIVEGITIRKSNIRKCVEEASFDSLLKLVFFMDFEAFMTTYKGDKAYINRAKMYSKT